MAAPILVKVVETRTVTIDLSPVELATHLNLSEELTTETLEHLATELSVDADSDVVVGVQATVLSDQAVIEAATSEALAIHLAPLEA